MPPDPVIEDLCVLKDTLSCNGSRCIGMTQFCFHGGEEGFCHGIVGAGPRSAHAPDDTMLGAKVPEPVTCILTSPIGMEDQRSTLISSPHCGKEGTDNQIIFEPLAYGTPHNGPGEHIRYDSTVEPALLCPDIGNIGYPCSIGCIDGIPLEKIGNGWPSVVGMNRHPVSSLCFCPYTMHAHEPSNSICSTGYAFGNTGASVCLTVYPLYRGTMIYQRFILLFPGASCSLFPSGVSAP